ncbi:uncharacterized protein B0H18DRAFT_1009385, partial [Fomitopsis serialis]|uniref:uncharacterized protein n=1 Tax=Fomitopsis serialis TaxID=139415 RepID=UPI00200824C2
MRLRATQIHRAMLRQRLSTTSSPTCPTAESAAVKRSDSETDVLLDAPPGAPPSGRRKHRR